jgi:aminomethyltransferase
MKRTPLYEGHVKLGGRLIEFGGWEMPVQYTSIVDEHQAVRTAVGMFDISHMGEVRVRGAGAAAFLNRMLTNDIRKLTPGLGQYTLLCNPTGGVIDDLYAYQLGLDDYLLIINASRIEADVDWLQQHAAGAAQVKLDDESPATGAVAIQGPRAAQLLPLMAPGASVAGTMVNSVADLKKNQIGQWAVAGQPVWISRTGYTGEDGFELVAAGEHIAAVWQAALASGAPLTIKPCGLGARDTLRTEVCYPLYGHELDEQTSPLEAGLKFFVALDKGDFVGGEALRKQQAAGPTRKLVAFAMTEKAPPPRPHYPILLEGGQRGEVTSGTQSPSLNNGVGLGYVPTSAAKPGARIQVEIRGRSFAAVTVPKPIYRKPN